MAQAYKIKEQQKRFEEAIKSTLTKMGVEARNYFVDSFKKQGWDGQSWKERKREGNGHAINIDTGDLWRSIKVSSQDNNSVTISTDRPYARDINEGNDRQPARKFMGDSEELKKRIEKIIDDGIRNSFKK